MRTCLNQKMSGRLGVFGLAALVLSLCGGPTLAEGEATAADSSGPSLAERKSSVVKAMEEAFRGNRRQIDHAMRVLDCAERLLDVADQKVDRLTVTVAAILHDIGRAKVGTKDHERDGAVLARRILEELQFDEPLVDHVSRIVGSHHSAKGIDTPEFRIVWIADRLVNQKRDHRDQEALKREYARESEILSQKIKALRSGRRG